MIRVGVSACLLGSGVRPDGGHKLEPALGALTEAEWVPVCPEVELGLGVPRPTIQIELRDGGRRLIEPATGRDLTCAMRGFAERRVAELGDLCGYVLKKKSPSCGLRAVPVVGGERDGVGFFAAALRARFPELPVVEDDELRDAAARARFWDQVRAYHSRAPGIQSP